MRSLILAATLALSAPVLAQNTGPAAPAAILANAPAGTRFGLLVVDDQGREVAAIRPDDRFIPASNTKLFTTAAAMALLHDQPADGAAFGNRRTRARRRLLGMSDRISSMLPKHKSRSSACST